MTKASLAAPIGKPMARDRLTPLLRQPSEFVEWGDVDWDLAIRQARRAGLLARLEAQLRHGRLMGAVPPAQRAHLDAARILATKHRADVARELRAIVTALAPLAVPVILLKGAAYAAAGLPPADGRLFGDIDILLPRDRLAEAERLLAAAGWNAAKTDAYDQRYYRDWMHELPPLQHERRQTAIDVHHTIVPPTAGFAVDAKRLRDAALAVAGAPGLAVLAPADMVLHSAAHLFTEGEFGRGLRDLCDLDLLLRHCAKSDPHFWDDLAERAAAFRLERAMHYALRFAAGILGTPVPERLQALGAPAPLGEGLMDALLGRALRPPHPSCADRLTPLALFLLYIRGHYLRMPLGLLMPHLFRKAFIARFEPSSA
ncbi:MAG TPA: nucleotidyltransferase family protein [Stellaceae bacterium]|nr:nucleotidyltransferase family protein [Stellaceae bacterium]